MSIAQHAARFSPQLGLDLGAEPIPAAFAELLPPRPPSHAMLVAAARENQDVRAYIADGIPTWSEERLQRTPPCYLVFEHGEVVGDTESLVMMLRHALKHPGMGRCLGVRPLRPDDDVLKYTIGLRRAATHPRRFRYEQRMALKSLLASSDRAAVTWAMQRSQRDFLAKARTHRGLAHRIAETTGLSLKEFWRTVRGR